MAAAKKTARIAIMKGSRTLVGLATIFGMISLTNAATETLQGAKVIEILRVSGSTYGGCMAKLNQSAQTAACGASWVSFGCSGEFISKSAAESYLNLATAAQVTNGTLRVVINDAQKYNGFCMVQDLRYTPG